MAAERRCKKHPEHKQTKGVCPQCLREKLDQLSASSSLATTSTSLDACSTTSFSSMSSTSVSESPKRQQEEPLRKSRSLASVIGMEMKEELREKRKNEMKMMKNKNKKKKERFWAKLIMGGGGGGGGGGGAGKKRRDGDVSLKHSKTLKEKSSSSFWLIFS